MLGDLPPHSSQTCFMLDSPEYFRKYLPTSVEPVKASTSTSMWRPSAWPAVSPKPGSTLNTPSGMPASAASSARRMAVSGDCSAGFRITELPAASAGEIFQQAISSGKFHGTTQATTPDGFARDQGDDVARGRGDLVVDLVDRLGEPLHGVG